MFIKSICQQTRCVLQNPVNSLQFTRNMSVLVKSLKYSKHGEPAEVLEIVEGQLNQPNDNEVLVKILAAPINPSDIITIQGTYPVKPKFPAVGGNECVAEVVSVGKKVSKLITGQHVVPFATGLGTWTTHALFAEEHLMPVSSKIGLAEASTLTVNPCTAYRMLKDFVTLRPGDCVIQNGANSAVGQAVHQLCKAWDIKSVGIVRDRPDIGPLKDYLKSLGATEVLTEEEIRASPLFKEKHLPIPRLALNCVGGKSATEVARHLEDKGVMVTYGGMSREPVVASTAALIFKDIAFRGFWMTRWTKENSDSPQRIQMFNDLCEMIEQGKFAAPVHEMVPLQKFREAMAAAMNFKGFTGKKFILDLQN
ncbi:enoyl-[acyl-carrier-protein] reductase, mitochondrial-like [Rhagoletis pomonella]|uniref:enoyl-[acyl-carrier-protein] reductase, mitochondrial-like n=1 Tax=Rhagoletis pomonella TaxID=28610 RepID=UPI00178672D7|nr:enoyl-[acyl-carrier-protein] reductase, mitochondrial-like [Rhagoletis pomonella]XP_036334327.1 enoyl-[acyl-carrier-protein] reductase, mitochondrial-like [Rhagoletis pomonella]